MNISYTFEKLYVYEKYKNKHKQKPVQIELVIFFING